MQNETRFESIRNTNSNILRMLTEEKVAYYAAKRIMDFVISFILLVLFSPIMLFTAIVVFIFSPGPVFFKQQRVGARRILRNGRYNWERVNFSCYKFRTMKINADSSILDF